MPERPRRKIEKPNSSDLLQKTRLWFRRDLWEAFLVPDSSKPHRYYDTEKDEAVRRAKAVSENKTSQPGQRRLIRIDPIPSDVQKQWAAAFVAGLSDADLQKKLHASLEQEPWHKSFSETLQTESNLRSDWETFKSHKAFEVIAFWIKDNGLDLYPLQREAASHQRPNEPSGPSQDKARVRDQALAAIGRLPLHELLGLRVPLSCLLE